MALALGSATGHAATVTGSGTVFTEARSLPDFQAITLAGSMDLMVRQGPLQPVRVQADDNLLPLLETVVDSTRHGSTLSVHWKPGHSVYTRSKGRITQVMPQLKALSSAGPGQVAIESFNTPVLQVTLSGSGDARMQGLTAGEPRVSIAGSGDAAVHVTKMLKVSIGGSADVSHIGNPEVESSVAGGGSAIKR